MPHAALAHRLLWHGVRLDNGTLLLLIGAILSWLWLLLLQPYNPNSLLLLLLLLQPHLLMLLHRSILRLQLLQ
jgi:hypothetical protein